MTAFALASFAREAPFRAAVAQARAEGWRIVGLWSPLPVELGAAGAAAARPIAWVAIVGGLLAATLFYAFIWWTATRAYPFDTGARPFHSWQVFLIAPIEVGALAAGIAGFVALLMRARLTRLHDGAFDLEEMRRASSDRFVIALACDTGEAANTLLGTLAELGAVHSRLVTP